MSPYPSPTSTAAYRANAVMTAPSEQLVVMLYDGARRFLTQAAAAMAERQIPQSHNKLRRAEAIIRHLRATLDMDQGGEVAQRLQLLYVFWEDHLRQGRLQQDPAKLDEVNRMLGQLRESWATIAAQ